MEFNPRNSLYSKSLSTLKGTSLPHPLKIFHGIIIFVEVCIGLLSSFSHSKLIESCKPQGDYERSNNMKSQTFGQEATQLRFCQSSGHGSSSRRHKADSDAWGPDEEETTPFLQVKTPGSDRSKDAVKVTLDAVRYPAAPGAGPPASEAWRLLKAPLTPLSIAGVPGRPSPKRPQSREAGVDTGQSSEVSRP